MLHVSRGETKSTFCVPALNFLSMMVLYNPVFRQLFVKSAKFDKIWTSLFGLASQTLSKFKTSNKIMLSLQDENQVLQTEVVIQLLWTCWNNSTFQARILNACIDRQEKDFFDISFSTFSSDIQVFTHANSRVVRHKLMLERFFPLLHGCCQCWMKMSIVQMMITCC